ncbi:Fanconi anemia group B protein isoform X1 [Lepisosteus oculatus]|uniref:Fanconi anemia group B protein isoform X1 n=1 Tax=Lepisosteus oculatus TaxID=7918 RepID=UPI0035F5005E
MDSTKLLAFNGEVLTFQVSGSELRFRRTAFRQSTGRFSVTSEGSALVSNDGKNVDILCCSSALDVKSGLVVPCVLLKQNKRKKACFQYTLFTLNTASSLEPQMKFKLQYEMRENVALLQGPTVLWSHEETVYWTSLQAGKVTPVPVLFSSVCFIGEVAVGIQDIIILGTQTPAAEQPVMFLGYLLGAGRSFDGAWLLPHEYSSVVTCLLIVTAEEVNGEMKTCVVAATSKNQLVWFEDGVPREVCQLPFEQAQNIQTVTTGRDSCLLVVTFRFGNVCAVWKEGFQVASRWEGVSALHVDDFVGCGNDQILLVFENHTTADDVLRDFRLTDLAAIAYTSSVDTCEDLNADGAVQENYHIFVQALETRLQCGLSSVQNIQLDLDLKDRVLLQSVQAFTGLIKGEENILSKGEEEGLVSLWEEDTAVDSPGEEAPVAHVGLRGLAEKVWQRVVGDSWVVGVRLAEEASLSVGEVSLSVLMEQGFGKAPTVIQTRSSVLQLGKLPFPCPSSQCRAEPAAKKTRLGPRLQSVGQFGTVAGGRAEIAQNRARTVIAATELAPLVAFVHLDCYLMLHATAAQNPGVWGEGQPVIVQCGRVSLDIKDISAGKLFPKSLNSKYATEEAVEDFLSLTMVLKKWLFQIRSPSYTLCDISKWLLGPMQCQRLYVNPDYLLLNNVDTSSMMLISWQEKTAFEGILLIHCSCQTSLLRFLNSLCTFLPSSCEVKQLKAGHAEDLAESLASSLEEEVWTVRNWISSLITNPTSEKQLASALPLCQPSPGLAGQLQQYREEFERDRKLSHFSLNSEVEVHLYRQLTEALADVQLAGDKVAWALCKS